MSFASYFYSEQPTFTDSVRNIFFWNRYDQYQYTYSSYYEAKFFLTSYISRLLQLLGTVNINAGEVLIYVFMLFSSYLGLRFAEIFDVFESSPDHIDVVGAGDPNEPITLELLQTHITNVSSLVDQMTQNRKKIIKQLWDLQIPLTMMKLGTNQTETRHDNSSHCKLLQNQGKP